MSLETAEQLAQLHTRMKRCRLCLEEGYEIYPSAVFSGGAEARIMTIGQAPGITEKETGRPFNAGSGSRLFSWLEEAGMNEEWFRSTQYMTSVTKCYPGRQSSGSGDRVPTRTEQDLCFPYLEKEIQIVDPALIIPIGRLAINLYYPKSWNLTRIISTQKEVDGRWIIPLPHPSGASRWHQIEENRRLIARAVTLIREHFEKLF